MIAKTNVKGLAIFGGERLFSTPKSTSNLLRPDIDAFLKYSKISFDQNQYTNNGPNVKLLEKRLARLHQTRFCITFSSGMWALVLAIRALSLRGKSEIIMPSLTYRRMPDIAAWAGLKPRFCEVAPGTLALTAETVEPCINSETALIMAVHPIVNCCNSEELVECGKAHGIPVLFDSVESVYETTHAGKVGKFGEAECFSMHACKLLNGFGGGYLTTDNEKLARKLASLRTYGFVQVDTIGIPGGMNAKLNELHAAMALASLDDLSAQIDRNRRRYHTYRSLLDDVPGIRLLEFDESLKNGYKNIVVEILDEWPLSRKHTVRVLNAENILAREHYYPPLHRKNMDFPYVSCELPLTDKLAERFMNMPCGQLVSNGDIKEIVCILKFIHKNATEISKRLSRHEDE